MSATITLMDSSRKNFQERLQFLEKKTIAETYRAMVKFLTNAQTLAKNKLKSDRHIVTSRLRNSIYVKTFDRKNEGTYRDNKGKTYNNRIEVKIAENEMAVGTNVEYAEKIEFLYDSFLYWGVKHSDAEQMGRDISQKLLGIRQ